MRYMTTCYDRQRGRGVVLADRRTDNILITLVEYMLHALDNKGVAHTDALGRAVVDVLRLRYRNNPIPVERWQSIDAAVNADARIDSRLLYQDLSVHQTFGAQNEVILNIYREQLNRLVDEFSWPSASVVLSEDIGFEQC